MISADSNQKKIKFEGYKALLERKVNEETAKTTGYLLQLPYSSSLLQIEYNGEITEADFLALAKQIPIRQVTEIAE